MFADLSVEKLFVLALIALFVLGPERLPAAVTWSSRAVRHVRRFADETQRSLQRELGPEVDHLREPLRELREPLRQLRDLRRPDRALGRYLSTPADPVPAGSAAAVASARPDSSRHEDRETAPGSQSQPPWDPDAT